MIDDTEYEIPSEDDPLTFDSMCDPKNPREINFQMILEAQERLKGLIPLTRCDRSRLSSKFNVDLYFKKEFQLPTGSFKERGACNALRALKPEMKLKGVVAASSGNHGSAMAANGQRLGVPVTLVMPTSAPLPKIKNCLEFGATVILQGATLHESKRLAVKIANERGMTYVNGYDHPHILAGQGTIGVEILQQVPDVDAIIVPVGGGGLIAGLVKAVKTLKPSVLVYGVNSVLCPSFKNSFEAGKVVYTPCDHTLADGLLVPMVGVNSFETAKSLVDKVVAIDEAYDMRAVLELAEIEKCVVEGAGAISFGSIIANSFPELANKKVVCVLSGGNIDAFVFGRVIDRALALESRLVNFEVIISDRIGGLAKLVKTISDSGACIRDIIHERCWLRSDVYLVTVKCTVETKGKEHAEELFKNIKAEYSSLVIGEPE